MSYSEIGCFERYLGKVFQFSTNLGLLRDQREYPDKDIANIFLACVYGSAFRIKSISRIEEETREGCLKKRVGSISDDTFQYGLDRLDVESVREIWNDLTKRAKRNGMFRNNQFNDYLVGVVDCIEVYSSYKRDCPRCLKRRFTTSKGEVTQYYHRIVVLSLVGYKFPIPLGLEFVEPGEGEVACALRLLKRLREQLGSQFLDIVIADAIYCTPHFFKTCEKMGIVPGGVLKENQEDLLQTALVNKDKTKPVKEWEEKRKTVKLWDLPEVFWYTANQDVRVIYAERESREKPEEEKSTEENKKNLPRVFAFSKQIDHLSAKLIYDIGTHRWDIDANLFMDLTMNWHLKHKTLHFKNAYENILSIRLISYMIFMFFLHRHINARRKSRKIKSSEMAVRLYRTASITLLPHYELLE